jgi:hypothetical protein
MNQVITPNNVTLDQLRADVADATKRQYGAIKAYAVRLCDVLPSAWYDVEHTDVSEEAKPTLAEATAFRAALKEAGHSNPSVMWTRVRNEARAHIEGAPEKGANTKTSIQLRMITDLTKLYRAGKREESLSTAQANAMTGIASALTALGVDLNMIVK